MRVNLKTLGCRLNEAELETWAQQLDAAGHQIVAHHQDADLVVLNSCAVTQDAVKKSRQIIRRTHREAPGAKLVVSGCYATLNPQEVAESLGVDLVIGNTEKSRLIDIAAERLNLAAMPAFSSEPGENSLFKRGRQRAFIKVQDGCRYRCTFCIVTSARGEEKSRTLDEIVEEINRLHNQGVQEFILTGVHLGGYGSDLGLNLGELVATVLDRTSIPRLRLGSLEPWDIPEGFFSLMQNPRFMPHLHLPLQSGSDSVLRRMARRCKTQDFAALVQRLRSAVPGINITTDIIVGFPGETGQEWEDTLAFIEALGFGHIHIFSYSLRNGTKAATLPDQVSETVKRERSRVLHLLAERQKTQAQAHLLGSIAEILWEQAKPAPEQTGLDIISGYTPDYQRVALLLTDGRQLENTITPVRITALATEQDYLLAEMLV
ncbi:tRNA (N(6)-L-threonylcarbamoyladenosine(37)-C(2))-methylthiotransferase MtaB [Candidatus Methylospira mobilis]|uniref:tRNA (N(6)-L-threonylcarbamoyladenosine(37)-C(2))-methylthiotransferase MtaB n=1 Tax=Candidatus Methylospira mobilis TaxID=1808979 RepID=A0A5Q0BRU0_9GAMM|nr:tRNA (N(6)-L-threonylcarbamoyladenosine(37)-C(2))-methylthiotransferase MtaB [Candidatus Methylospira mobilis]QFY44787.1 tRNA (N(6)-L-threonylcarbamoyladenosine(37)-C(2))-methylthiotransferase MtaB [Candidatus Methylospira mobilis]WNV05672.1 tRNA (N(6)-L-threonylcarbamoyladenosine(37)-C(2))-methylthiotransferase MtaB [Candidatus Methylospira mobilis]